MRFKEFDLPIVPGRGLVTKSAMELRLAYLKENDFSIDKIADSSLELNDIQNNIESNVGSLEIPLGLVGPIKFCNNENDELVYAAVGTLEGALVASMNRGAKALSLSGGFKANVHWQKMVRSPFFLFETAEEAEQFKSYINSSFKKIKAVTKQYSNHAELLNINVLVRDENVHLKFVYSTGDASGQNMTTTCTWHAMLFVVDEFKKSADIVPKDFVIEGNGASDKKVSQYNIKNGRGINVSAECFLSEQVINKVLRTTSKKMEDCFNPSRKLANEEGMVGYNINVANAVAAFFIATGQDLGSVHESAVGFLELTRNDKGLHLKLTLPNLVVGTVGGGTQLPTQAEALKLMGCLGTGKVNRLAKVIAGFALGLEISTYAAIVSGEFAKAHEKLGRNKPVQWLLRSELTSDFLKSAIQHNKESIELISESGDDLLENGILTNIASRISKKLIGFVPLNIKRTGKNGIRSTQKVLLKSKALDQEIIKGLHLMASSIDTELADLIKDFESKLEYKNSHIKEIHVNAKLHELRYQYIPKYYGKKIVSKREIFFFIQEFFDYSKLKIVESENQPELWGDVEIKNVLKVLSDFHQLSGMKDVPSIQEFNAFDAIPLYKKLLQIVINERVTASHIEPLNALVKGMQNWEHESASIEIPKTVIHNDFNPRNIVIRENGIPCIYDWELAVIDFPSKDVVEFLSFALARDFSKEEMFEYLNYYSSHNSKCSTKAWSKAFTYSLKTYIATRISFYEVSGIVIKYDFSSRILEVSLRMLKFLQEDE
ncbi:MAG: hydroxymethylglutaryl-CoA reductase (NADPH) [Glaciecola sp.]|jgi:hydroxymethylglutaryl-CoA reductase (NADPH)